MEILQSCVSFNKTNTYAWQKGRVYILKNTPHDPTDRGEAFQKVLAWGERIPLGVLYRSDRKTYEELVGLKGSAPLVDRDVLKSGDWIVDVPGVGLFAINQTLFHSLFESNEDIIRTYVHHPRLPYDWKSAKLGWVENLFKISKQAGASEDERRKAILNEIALRACLKIGALRDGPVHIVLKQVAHESWAYCCMEMGVEVEKPC